jgi:hypothetical protein
LRQRQAGRQEQCECEADAGNWGANEFHGVGPV